MNGIGLTNHYIERFLYNRSKTFKGVFSSDTLPKFKNDFTLISNLSKKNEVGTHFVCIAYKKGKLYYDGENALH